MPPAPRAHQRAGLGLGGCRAVEKHQRRSRVGAEVLRWQAAGLPAASQGTRACQGSDQNLEERCFGIRSCSQSPFAPIGFTAFILPGW